MEVQQILQTTVRNTSLLQERVLQLQTLRPATLWANTSSAMNDSVIAADVDVVRDEPVDGLEAVDPPFQHALLCIYSLTAIFSITGNLIVILVLSLGKRSSTDLRAFLINLAVSDVTMAVFSIPFTYTMFMWGRWVFLPWFCPVALAMQHVSVIVSVYTLTAIGVDRYNAILHPFERRITKLRTKLVIAGIWLVAAAISSSQLVVSRAEPFKYNQQWYWQCDERWSDHHSGQLYTIFIFIVTFAVPLFGLCMAYCAIARRMWMHSAPGNADRDRDLVQLKAKRKVIKMLVTIVALFSLCWLPLQVFLLCWYFIPDFGKAPFYKTNLGKHVYALSFLACHWLANANSFVNPLVYCFMSDNFKADLRDLLSLKRATRFRSVESQPLDSRQSTRTTIIQHGSSCRRWAGSFKAGIPVEVDLADTVALHELRVPLKGAGARSSPPSYI